MGNEKPNQDNIFFPPLIRVLEFVSIQCVFSENQRDKKQNKQTNAQS